MKSFFLIAGTVVYTFLGVVTFQTFEKRNICDKHPVVGAIFAEAVWPVAVVTAGGMVVLADQPGPWRCQSK